jgi:hypothetical protein
MIKLAQLLFLHGCLARWCLAHLPQEKVGHDPNARSHIPRSAGPGLFGILVSNRVSRP